MAVLIWLVVAIVVYLLLQSLIAALPGDPKVKQAAQIILIIVAVLYLLQVFVHPLGGFYPRY